MTNIENLLEEYTRQVNKISMEVMQEIYARLPYDSSFTLSDGSVCKLKKFVAPKICKQEGHQYYDMPYFGFDVIIEGGKLDHLEFETEPTHLMPLPTGKEGEIVRVLVEALKYYDNLHSGDNTALEALAKAEELAGEV